MNPHAGVTPIPVEMCFDLVAGGERGVVCGGNVHDIGLVIAIQGSGYGDFSPVPSEFSAIAGLAAGGCVKDRPIENDAASVIDADDARFAGAGIGIVSEQELGHAGSTASKTGGDAAPLDSSQFGTGIFLERRKPGLKSFD